jgi:hypothetical protein
VSGGLDAYILQRLLVDIREQIPIDLVGLETIGILTQAEVLQPL